MARTLTSPTPLPVLIATADSALQEVLADLLAEEGYAPYVASSLTDALALTEKRAFSMFLAEVFTGTSPRAWDDAQTLLHRAHPAPVGLLVTYSHVPEAIARAGFAFVQLMPFEIDELIARVAAATTRPLTPRQQHWVAIVNRYCAALAAADWNALLELCADDMVFYPPKDSRATSQRKLVGKDAVSAYFQAIAAGYRSLTYADLCFYPRSRGLTVRCTATWIGVDGHAYQAATTLRLRFDGERISQISLQMNHTRALRQARSCPA